MTDSNLSASTNEMNAARHRVYQLLSALFAKELNWPMVKEMNGKAAQEFWLQLAKLPEFKPHVNAILSVIAELKTEENLLELAADYCGLFLVDTRNSASPYASLYMGDKEATLFGEQHQQITEFLKQHKLQVKSEFPEPADHLAVILAYAGHLVLNASEGDQADYIRDYIANWLTQFVGKVQKVDPGSFYTALAQLTLAWVNSELEWLDSVSPLEQIH